MRHVKKDHEEYLLFEWRKLPKDQGPKFELDLDTPIPPVLLDRLDYQLTIGGYTPNVQRWTFEFTTNSDGNVTHIKGEYTGKEARQPAWHAALRIKPPWNPGSYFQISAGRSHDTLVRDFGREEALEEIECPECEAYLCPVPPNCPQCGEKLMDAMPTLGELVKEYGEDAVLGAHASYASAELIISFTRTQEQADKINAEREKKHEEKVAHYKAQLAAWNELLAPSRKKEAKEQEARERAELERLKAKFPDAQAEG